jgi:cell division septum initiation protein DivIVA
MKGLAQDKKERMMAEKTPHDEEVAKLRARIDELEAQLKSRHKSSSSTARNASDSISDATRTKRDSANRMVRGMTMASIEGVRLFADTISSFADGVASRNDARDHKTASDLVSNLPSDIANSFADAVAGFTEIPSKTADKYSSSYHEGEKAV